MMRGVLRLTPVGYHGFGLFNLGCSDCKATNICRPQSSWYATRHGLEGSFVLKRGERTNDVCSSGNSHRPCAGPLSYDSPGEIYGSITTSYFVHRFFAIYIVLYFRLYWPMYHSSSMTHPPISTFSSAKASTWKSSSTCPPGPPMRWITIHTTRDAVLGNKSKSSTLTPDAASL